MATKLEAAIEGTIAGLEKYAGLTDEKWDDQLLPLAVAFLRSDWWRDAIGLSPPEFVAKVEEYHGQICRGEREQTSGLTAKAIDIGRLKAILEKIKAMLDLYMRFG